MANYGNPGQFGDDTDLDNQFQEEYRRRSGIQQQSAISLQRQIAGLNRSGMPIQQQAESYAYANSPFLYPGTTQQTGGMGIQQQQQMPGMQGFRPSPYTQVTNPYSGLAEARAAYARGAMTGDTSAAQQMYAQQIQQQQQRLSYPAQQPQSQMQSYPYAQQARSMDFYNVPAYRDYAPQSTAQLLMQQQQQQDASDPYAALRSKPKPKYPMDADDSGYDSEAESSGRPKKQMLQKVTSTINKANSTARIVVAKDGSLVIEDGPNQWFTGCIPLGLDDDKYWLSELQVYLRANFAEAFGATEEDIAAPMHGRNKPIALGQVGIRCMHCKNDNPAERGQQATSYPSLISGIYNSVQQMLRLHLECCLSMPSDVRSKIESLKVSCSSRGGRKLYWIDSAKRLGLVDTPHGIHFARNPLGPLPPLSGPSVNSKEGRLKKKAPLKANSASFTESAVPMVRQSAESGDLDSIAEAEEYIPPQPPIDTRPLVFPEDKGLISDYLYLTLEQMSPSVLMEADRVGCYKTRAVGFPGLACRHCVGQAGCGRYFPATEASLSQTTTSQTIMNHVRNCRRCPIEIRESLEFMKRSRVGPDGKRMDKPKHGGRKVFFHRLWCRIQGLTLNEPERIEKPRKRKSPSKNVCRDSDEEGESSDQEEEEEEEDSGTDSEREASKSKGRRKSGTPRKKRDIWYHGCVRLTKTDDSNWLSEMECFARSELVEVFTLSKDELNDNAGRKEPSEGQVGIRCTFCKSLDPSERPASFAALPDTLSSIHTKVTDMIRLHFPNCPAMPDDARATFKSYKGFDAKVANDDSQQYWVDAARDIGLMNIPPDECDTNSWGITFRRDPLEPSPADELDLEQSNSIPDDYGENSLLVPDDRGSCTDHVMLLLRQVRPCCFQKSDMRAGPASRGRDRTLGFPGLACIHCVGRNATGRYFPISPKNLTDNTVNSLQTHVAACYHCPEPIKASLAYLSHRSILQKAELSGSWKKAFFQKVWDRLHVNRSWTSIDDEVDDELFVSVDESEDESDSADDDGENKESNQMTALIKAAAIWLTNQDAASGHASKKGRRVNKNEGEEIDGDISGKKRRTRK